MIRPQAARWFEAVVARDDAFLLLEALAASGCAEIEIRAPSAPGEALRANFALKEYSDLARRYRTYWPAPRLREAAQSKGPAQTFESALATLRAWSAQAEPEIARLQQGEAEEGELVVVARALSALQAGGVDVSRLAAARAPLRSRVLVYPEGAEPAIPEGVLVHLFTHGAEPHAVVLGAAAAVEQLEREVAALHGRAVALPDGLAPDVRESLAAVQARRESLERENAQRREAIAALGTKHGMAFALGDVARASWCFAHVGAIEAGGALARITGWTDDVPRLSSIVEACGARALVSFPPPPKGARAPLLLRNPWWVRPFEWFARLFGMPDREGVDPSAVLAVAAPLLFGYMFGDVGQGAVLLAAGLALRRKHAPFALLIPGGIAAMAFGFVFGSVFGEEGIVPALWISPLASPLAMLVVPLCAGAALLTCGLALHALEAWWRHELARWLRRDAGLVAVYLGLAALPFDRAGAWIAALGVAASLAGRAWDERRASAALPALGELAERTVQILVNTLSFARVGAFALAHAGLGAAIVALAAAAGSRPAGIAVFVAGNAVVIVLEGMVVGIQTTRLILFEFFVRFFESQGREFRPLAPPITTEERP